MNSTENDRRMDAPSVKDYIDTRFETLTAVMEAGFAKVDAKFAGVDAKLATVAAEIRTEMYKGFSDQLKWLLTTMIALFVALVAVMAFMFNNLAARLPPPQAAVQSAPAAVAPASPPSTLPPSPRQR